MDLMVESFPRLLNATKLTIELTLLSLFFGIFVGAFFAVLRTSNNKFFYYTSYYYSYIFREPTMGHGCYNGTDVEE